LGLLYIREWHIVRDSSLIIFGVGLEILHLITYSTSSSKICFKLICQTWFLSYINISAKFGIFFHAFFADHIIIISQLCYMHGYCTWKIWLTVEFKDNSLLILFSRRLIGFTSWRRIWSLRDTEAPGRLVRWAICLKATWHKHSYCKKILFSAAGATFY